MSEGKGTGKLICKVGDLGLLLEKYGTGTPEFKFVVTDDKDKIKETVPLSIVDVIFLSRCLEEAISACMDYNIRKGLLE